MQFGLNGVAHGEAGRLGVAGESLELFLEPAIKREAGLRIGKSGQRVIELPGSNLLLDASRNAIA